MNVVRIAGTRDQLLSLGAVEGLVLATHSTRLLEPDRWEVSAHASDAAIAAVTALGAVVEVDRTAQEEEQLLASLYDEVRPDDGMA